MEVCYLNETRESIPYPGGSVTESIDYVWLRGSGMLAELVINVRATYSSMVPVGAYARNNHK